MPWATHQTINSRALPLNATARRSRNRVHADSRGSGPDSTPFETIIEMRRAHEREGVRIADVARRFDVPYARARDYCQYLTRVYR